MKPAIYTIQILSLFILISSCNQSGDREDNVADSPDNTIHLIETEDTLLLDLDPLLENTSVIQLDNNPDALTIYMNPVSVKDGRIVIGQRGRALMYFDAEDGNYRGEIGSPGVAPGEYRGTKNIALNPSGNMVAIQPNVKDNPILIYEISPGDIRMIKEIVNPEGWNHTNVLWTHKGKLLIMYITKEEDQAQIIKQDIEQGPVDSVFIKIMKGGYGTTNFNRYNDDILIKLKQVDTLYRLDENNMTLEKDIILDRGYEDIDTLDFVSLQESDPGNLSAYMKQYPDYELLAHFNSGFLLKNRFIDFQGSGKDMRVTIYIYWYFVDPDDGKLRRVTRARFRPFPGLPPMIIHIDKVKFDSWGHLIIQIEPIEVEEAYEDEPDFKDAIQDYLFYKSETFDINSNSFLFTGDVKAS